MQLEQFNDLGINTLKATEWMERFGITPDDLTFDNARFLKVKDIFQFLSKYENADYLITKLNRGFTKDLVQKTWEYINKYQEKQKLSESAARIEKEIDLIKDIPDAQTKVGLLRDERLETLKVVRDIEHELAIYESSN